MVAIARGLRDYCEVLGVSPNASDDEIRLAYLLRRREVTTSGEYTDAELKAAFEALTRSGRGTTGAPGAANARHQALAGVRMRACAPRSAVNAIGLLVFLAIVLAGVVVFYLWPNYSWRLRTFHANDSLVEATTGKPYGTVLDFDADHAFPNGAVGAAYRLRLERDGAEVWYPASDVQYLCIRH